MDAAEPSTIVSDDSATSTWTADNAIPTGEVPTSADPAAVSSAQAVFASMLAAAQAGNGFSLTSTYTYPSFPTAPVSESVLDGQSTATATAADDPVPTDVAVTSADPAAISAEKAAWASMLAAAQGGHVEPISSAIVASFFPTEAITSAYATPTESMSSAMTEPSASALPTSTLTSTGTNGTDVWDGFTSFDWTAWTGWGWWDYTLEYVQEWYYEA